MKGMQSQMDQLLKMMQAGKAAGSGAKGDDSAVHFNLGVQKFMM